MSPMRTLLFCLFTLVACDPPAPSPSEPRAPTKQVKRPSIDKRDQYMLANDITAALSADDEEDPAATSRMAKRWRERRVQWEVRFLPALCQRHDRCIVTLNARVAEIEVSPELPTRMTLDRIGIEGARTQRVEESWVVARR